MDACEQSVEHKRARVAALVTAAAFRLSLLVLAASVLLHVLSPRDPSGALLVVAAAGFSGLTLVLAIRERRSARCPLCGGVPFLERGTLTFRRARHLFPLNHRGPGMPTNPSHRRFRCTYCGSRYNVLVTRWFRIRVNAG